MGVGNGLKNAYTTDYLNDNERKNFELANCLKLQKKYGILKSGFPSPNEFSKRLAENGIVGLVLYLFPLLFLLKMYWKKKNILVTSNSAIILFIVLMGSLMAGMSGLLTTVHTYWLVLGLVYAYLDENGIL